MGSDLVGQSAERGVSRPATRGKQILKSFIHFLPVNQKNKMEQKSCFSFFLHK